MTNIYELTPFLVIVSLAVIALVRKDFELAILVISMFLFGIVLSPHLKTCFNEPRPNHTIPKTVKLKPVSSCQGMPSSHAFIFSMLTSFLYLRSISAKNGNHDGESSETKSENLDPEITISGIATLLMCLQRLIHGRHTMKQLIVGLVLGSIAGSCVFYLSKKMGTKTVFYGLLFSSVFVILIYLIEIIQIQNRFYNYIKKEPVPSWMDSHLVPILEKKKEKRSSFGSYLLFSTIPEIDTSNIYTWKILENMMDEFLEKDFREYNPELIIGIKTGGVFIANYLSYKSGVEYASIRVSHYPDTSLIGKLKHHAVKEPVLSEIPPNFTEMISGKRVLIVDDIVGSGATIRVAKDKIKEEGARMIRTYTVFTKKVGFTDFESLSAVGLFMPWGNDA